MSNSNSPAQRKAHTRQSRWVTRLVRFIDSWLVSRGHCGHYRIIAVGGPCNHFPHGIPITPKSGWTPIEYFVDEPSSLPPQTGLATESASQPDAESGIADHLENRRLEQKGILGGVTETLSERRIVELPNECVSGRRGGVNQNNRVLDALLTVCRYAFYRIVCDRRIKNAPEIVYQKLVRKDLENITGTLVDNQELAVTNERLLACERQSGGTP